MEGWHPHPHNFLQVLFKDVMSLHVRGLSGMLLIINAPNIHGVPTPVLGTSDMRGNKLVTPPAGCESRCRVKPRVPQELTV